MDKTERGNITHSWYALSVFILLLYVLLTHSSCSAPSNNYDADKLNEISYAYHYRDIDSTQVYAEKALALSEHYDAGKAEALNNLAFVSIIKMDYARAYKLLDSIASITDNQIELLVADIHYMRLCQRESRNKEFYDYHEKANLRIKRINEEKGMLNEHLKHRMVYATTEFNIITSTYYYYVGLRKQSQMAMAAIPQDGGIRTDTAQLLAYYYNIGSGDVLTDGTQNEIYQQEFEYLVNCYAIAKHYGYIFWEANALQALSEHLQVASHRKRLIADNQPYIKFINTDNMPDSLLAGNLAQRSLDLFKKYGDVYQTAGAYRTLAQCYWFINDYQSSIACLDNALNTNKAINQAPDLIASIREQFSVIYSAMNDKPRSDYNRNLYLDIQERTRQDRALEARADQLDKSANILNWMIAAIVMMTIIVLVSLYFFDRLRKKSYNNNFLKTLLEPLEEWQKRNEVYIKDLEDKYEEMSEECSLKRIDVIRNKKRNLEQRAKVSLVNNITPFIDRILNEIRHLENTTDNGQQQERYEYIRELTNKINDYNSVLTEWIQLRQGDLRLQIETFSLNELFDIVRRGSMSFLLKGIDFTVESTTEYVKADKILTLFMINTLADNARKFTEKGEKVTVSADSSVANYVEISVEDTGKGLEKEKLDHLFDRNPIKNDVENTRDSMAPKSHGFGLVNCLGIINKYKKTSRLFEVCMIAAESTPGKGSRFYFRLPKGVARTVLCLLFSGLYCNVSAAKHEPTALDKAAAFADSAYFSNINGNYSRTLVFADSSRIYLNRHYIEQYPTDAKNLMKREGNVTEKASEIKWFQNGVRTNYDVILSIRNESAVAALALHQWSLYRYCNNVYTQLFKEVTADKQLGEYCRIMQKSETNKNIAIVILLLLLLMIFPAYYFLYYRHHIYYRFCIEQIRRINGILLGDETPDFKLKEISAISTDRFPEDLKDIVLQIKAALTKYVSTYSQEMTRIELMEDECRRADYESGKLYINNNVLDNCLSTLKHETMYYPSRIRQLVDTEDKDIDSIKELATFYKELYTILSMQATRQAETQKRICKAVLISEIIKDIDSEIAVLADPDLLEYLFEILKRENGKSNLSVSLSNRNGHYVDLHINMDSLSLTEKQCTELFYPDVKNLPYLLCRQIIRDTGEASNMRGCGIVARPSDKGTDIIVTLAIYNNKKRIRKHEEF